MLYKTIKKLITKNGLTDELRSKIDLLYTLNRLSEEEYKDLVDVED